jgi:hypothetical protein
MKILNEYPEFSKELKNKAVLRRAFWRKIEIEYEMSLIANTDDQIDPYHRLSYTLWKEQQEVERKETKFDKLRKSALEKIKS